MKIYIIADMEGICGVVSADQITGNSAWDADRVRRQFTDEINVVCQAAIQAGVEEIVINDFHGAGRNILLERLPPQAYVIQGAFRSTAGWDMLDNTFQGLIFLGAHARTGSSDSILPHTYSNKVRFELFGQQVGECEIMALLAGEFKVPTILISGDQKAIEQARTNIPTARSVITKFAINSSSAMCFHPKTVLDALKEETRQAIINISSIEPPTIVPPIPLVIRPLQVEIADRIDWIPQLKRNSDLSFEFIGENMRQVAKLIYGITMLSFS